ncbi:hypothetical protein [Mesoflavibacter zeaxanthinifaciens]|uniref:hypothetical protein n=1 Tax=Mesoflavibacter zeaxanthinifaciens TaxID=393060 RepID=UPI0026EBC5B5|nr:hypothetical protein [Mesoflavibacter zeaxanthinifaciens]
MARDYTKYNVEGLGENLNKRKLVFTIVKDWVEKNNPSFEDLQKAFPDEIQGSKGVVKKEAEVKDPKRYNVKEPLKIKNGAHVVVCNQWGDNIGDFITASKKLGYRISENSSVKMDVSTENKEEANNLTIENFYSKIKEGDYFSKTNFYKFESDLKTILSELDAEDDSHEDKMEVFFDKLFDLIKSDELKYTGIAYLCLEIAGKYDFYSSEDIDWELMTKLSYSMDNLVSNKRNIVGMVCDEVDEDDFISSFITRFIFTVIMLPDELGDMLNTEMAELIVSCDQEQYKFNDDSECWICDLTIEILSAMDLDIYQYEGECTIYPENFLSSAREMGYDYNALGQEIINRYA